MELIRGCFERLAAKAAGPTAPADAIEPVNKVLCLDLMIILEAFADAQVQQVLELERTRRAAMRTLTAGLAHEVRNPLNSAILQLELASRRLGSEPPEAPAAMAAVDAASEELVRLANLLGEFLDFAVPRPPRRETRDLRVLLEAIVAEQATDGSVGGAEVRLLPGEAAPVLIDGERLAQAIRNLVTNATEASGSAGRVELRLTMADAHVIIEVADEGPGLPTPVERLAGRWLATGPGMPSSRRASSRHVAPTTLLRTFAAHPPLEPVVEQELARRYRQTGDPAIAHRLVRANLRLVLTIAGEYAARSRAEYLDLVQEGSLGLVEAVRRFDPERGVRLMSYAGFWVRAYVLRHILDSSRLVRPGRSRASRAAFFRGERPPVELSLQSTALGSEGAELLSERLADPDSIPADQALERAELERLFASEATAFAASLAPRDATVFRERLVRPEPIPLARIADRYSVSKERIRQIERNLSACFQTRLAGRLLPGGGAVPTMDAPAGEQETLPRAA